jgi:hypothetical protein
MNRRKHGMVRICVFHWTCGIFIYLLPSDIFDLVYYEHGIIRDQASDQTLSRVCHEGMVVPTTIVQLLGIYSVEC